MTESKQQTTIELENLNPTVHVSKSFYERIYEQASESPFGAISSICALFIVIILAITIPLLFQNNSSC